MARLLNVPASVVPLTPGGQSTIEVVVRNDASIVDELAIDIVGEPGAWAEVSPRAVRLFPGDRATVTIRFSPPRIPTLHAGRRKFGIRATSREQPAGNCVEEGAVLVAPFSSFSVDISPRTSSARRSAQHEVIIQNDGNVPLAASVGARDVDGAVRVDVPAGAIEIAPGDRAALTLPVRAARWHWRGAERPRPFQVTVQGPSQARDVDAIFLQRPLLPGWVGQIVLAIPGFVLAAAALVALIGQPWKTPPIPTPPASQAAVRSPAVSPTAEPSGAPTPSPAPATPDVTPAPTPPANADVAMLDGFTSLVEWDASSFALQGWTVETVSEDPPNTAACVLSYIDNVSARMSRTIDLPPTAPLTIDISAFYETEADVDGLIIWARAPGTIGSQELGSVSGSSDGRWVEHWADLSAFAGRTIDLTFEFRSDQQYAPEGGGMCIDYVAIVNAAYGSSGHAAETPSTATAGPTPASDATPS